MKIYIRLAVVALIIRFAYFLQHANSPFFEKPLLDQHYYDLCARQLAGAGEGIIDGFRPLLYPLFASLFYGIDLDSGMLLTIVAQHLLGICMVLLSACLAMRLFEDTKAAIVTGLLFSLSGPPLFFEGELLITTLFSCMLLLLWVVIHYAIEAPTTKRAILRWLLAGMVLGLASQARPNALSLVLLFPVVSSFRLLQPKLFSKIHAALPLTALAGMLAVQIFFGTVNARYSGTFSLMTQAGGINLFLGNSQTADGMIPRQSKYVTYDGEYRDPIQIMAEQGYQEVKGQPGTQKEISVYWKEKAISEIRQDPFRWSRLVCKKTWLMLWNHEVPNNRSFAFAATRETPLLRWLPVRWWLLLALMPWGVANLYRKGKSEYLVWILSFLVLFAGTVVLFFVNSRFRIPLWPGMAILAGGGSINLWSQLKARKVMIAPFVFSIGLLALSTINWFGIPPDPIDGDYALRASAYHSMGNDELALCDIQKALETTQNNPGYHFQHGNILMALGKNEAAINAYLKAVSLEPGIPMMHNNLGIAFESSGKKEQAIVAYHKALELRPGYFAARTNLLLLHIQMNRFAEARLLLGMYSPSERQHPTVQCASSILDYKETGNERSLSAGQQLNPKLAQQLLSDID